MGLFDFFRKKEVKKEKTAKLTTNNTINNTQQPQFQELTVEKVGKETPTAVSIYFSIPPTLKAAFTYQAGQYITIRQFINGQPILRSYSLSSCPLSDDYFRIGVKEKVGGALSGTLVRQTKAGETLAVFPPLGTFTPDLSKNTKHYFLFAGGSGITPLLSIAKTVLTKKLESTLTLIYANRNQESIMYNEELTQLEKKYKDRLDSHYILDEKPNAWTGLTGIFKAQDYAQLLQEKYSAALANAEYFICGPEVMMQEVEQGLTQMLQIPTAKVHVEYFTMEKQPTTHQQKLALTPNLKPNTTAQNKVVATIQLDNTETEVVIPKGETVLEAVLNKGLDAPYMCEAGVCSTCRAKLESGKVQMQACHSLSKKEIAEGYILTCQAIPQTSTLRISYDI